MLQTFQCWIYMKIKKQNRSTSTWNTSVLTQTWNLRGYWQLKIQSTAKNNLNAVKEIRSVSYAAHRFPLFYRLFFFFINISVFTSASLHFTSLSVFTTKRWIWQMSFLSAGKWWNAQKMLSDLKKWKCKYM